MNDFGMNNKCKWVSVGDLHKRECKLPTLTQCKITPFTRVVGVKNAI